MKAITLWQPWASLCVLPRPSIRRCVVGCANCDPTHPFYDVSKHPPFKTIETRSWPAPKALIGQRIAIHAAKRSPDITRIGPFTVMDDRPHFWLESTGEPDYCALPLGAIVGTSVLADCVPIYHIGQLIGGTGGALWPNIQINGRDLATLTDGKDRHEDVSDQRPFDDFAPGRWAWLLADAIAFDEPVPARGGQGIWNWEPA